jgi:hypothetical protein
VCEFYFIGFLKGYRTFADGRFMYGKIQKLRFLAMGLSVAVSACAFFAGALWLSSTFNAIEKVRTEDSGREIRSMLNHMRQVLVAEAAIFTHSQGALILESIKTKRADFYQKNMPESFDAVAVFNSSLGLELFVQGNDKNLVASSNDNLSIKNKFSASSLTFERAQTDGQASGFIVLAGKPYVLAIKSIKAKGTPSGFFMALKKIDTRRLAPTASVSEAGIDLLMSDPSIGMPPDVEEARKSMVGDDQLFVKIVKRGDGVGYLRIDDLLEETAFILRYRWSDASQAMERNALAGLFIFVMILGGGIHFLASAGLTVSARSRKLKSGLSGMSDRDIQAFVESFPGYAFALNKDGAYTGVSRSLAGLIGREPSELFQKSYGESDESGLEFKQLFSDLESSSEWPAVVQVSPEFNGLGYKHSFKGSAHFIVQRKNVLFILTAHQSERHKQTLVAAA